AFRTDFARHAGDFRGERTELIDHRVNGVFQFENFAFDINGDLLRQVAVGHRGCDFGNVSHLPGQVTGHEVDVVGEVFPRPGHAFPFTTLFRSAFGADFARHARDFRGERTELVDHRVDGVLEFENLAFDINRDLLRQVAVGYCRGDLGD